MSSARTCKRRLDEGLKALRLPTMRGDFAEVAHRARTESLSYEQFLLELVESERDVRRQRRIERVLRASRLPLLPRKVDAHVNVLLEGTFLDRCENVLAFGQPGSGKTHLLCAIGQELVYQGHRVLYRPCDLLVQELLAAKRDLDLPRTLKQLSRHDLLIIDDIAYTSSTVGRRWRSSSICWPTATSNLPFPQWEQIFKDPMTTAAAIDRVVHHSVVLELNIPSYRLEDSKKRHAG